MRSRHFNQLMLKVLLIVITVSGLCFSNLSFALPFTVGVRPGFPFPTFIFPGENVKAFYIVSNNALVTKTQNFVKYLPPNVTQVLSDVSVPNLCGARFDLNARGLPNSSCILELNITGAVNSQDPNPQNHLFVCYSHGSACAGPTQPLNVSLIPALVNTRFITVGSFNLGGGTPPGVLVDTVANVDWINIDTSNISGTIVSSNLFDISCRTTHCATVGQYNAGAGFQPAIVVSQNNANDWHYVIPGSAPPPGIFSSSNLSSVTCVAGVCAAVGNYDLGAGRQPALIVSYDQAVSWNFVVPADGPPTPINEANLNKVICPDGRCIAVGQYDAGTGFQPAIIESTDIGQTWKYVSAGNLPPPGIFTSMALTTLDCIGNTCAIAGQYNLGAGSQPAIIVSLNGGSWNFVQPTNGPGIIRSTTMRANRCLGTTCVAVGRYSTGTTTGPYQLATIVSTDSANTWHFVYPTNSPGTTTDAVLTSTDCVGNTCVGVGQYDVGAGMQPIIAVSTDNAANWRYVTPTNSPNGLTGASLNAVKCTQITCIAVGQYNIVAGTQPALIVSLDLGNTWRYVTASGLPTGITAANLFSADCEANRCVAVGQYNTGSGTQPLVMNSEDRGATWQFAPSTAPGVLNSARLNVVHGVQ